MGLCGAVLGCVELFGAVWSCVWLCGDVSGCVGMYRDTWTVLILLVGCVGPGGWVIVV